MTNRQLGELAIGLLALYLAFIGILASSMFVIGAPSSLAGGIRTTFPLLVYFAVAASLWLGRRDLAARLFDNPATLDVSVRAATNAVRIVGLLMIMRVAGSVGSIFTHGPGRWGVAASALPTLVSALIAAYLIFRGERLVAWMTSASSDEKPTDTAAIAFATVGLYMTATSLPALVSLWMNARARSYGQPYVWGAIAGGRLVEHALIVILGLALFIGSAGFARLLRAIRRTPRVNPDHPNKDGL